MKAMWEERRGASERSRRSRACRVAASAVWGGLMLGLFSASEAQANFMTDGRYTKASYFNPGILLGAAIRDGHVVSALGAELSLHRFDEKGLGVGGFGRWQWMALTSHRFTLGAQVTSPVYQVLGVEMGVAHESGDVRNAGTTSIHVAPFLSFGVVALSLRVGIPFRSNASSLPGRSFEGGLDLSLKVPNEIGP